MRLDKWLWVARFFKTRQQALEAINGGKVHVNGHRTKPGKTIQPGSRVTITKEPFTFDIEICGLDRQRRPFETARLLYAESSDSQLKRQEIMETRREEASFGWTTEDQRPNKRDRRLIHRFKRQNDPGSQS